MATKWRNRFLVGTLALVAAMGCNPIVSLSYLFNNGDPKTPPEYPLTPQPSRKHEEVRIVVITSARPGLNEFRGIDQSLNTEFKRALENMAKETKEKITVLSNMPLSRYREEHPEWQSHHPIDIGKQFGADYVIDMEVLSISLFKPGTNRSLLQGKVAIALSAYDLSKREKVPALEQEYTTTYPASHEMDADSISLPGFRQKMLQRIASDLAIKFIPHTTSQFPVDD